MWSGWFLLIVDSKRGGKGVPTICRFLILGVLFSFFNLFFVLGLVQANYHILTLGTEQGWSGWYLLIVDSIRGGKGGFLLIVDFQFFGYIFRFLVYFWTFGYISEFLGIFS